MTLVREVMTKIVAKGKRSGSVAEAARVMKKEQKCSFIVEEDGESVGILTDTDIVRKCIAGDRLPSATLVEKVMTSPVTVMKAGASLGEAVELMAEHHIRHLVIKDQEHLVGIVSARDLLRHILLFEDDFLRMPVGIVMRLSPHMISPEETVLAVARIMDEKKVGSLFASQGKKVVGIVTECDIVRKVVAEGYKPADVPVRQIMSSPVLMVSANRPVLKAGHLMEKRHIRHAGVSEEGRLTGVLSIRDLLELIHLEKEYAQYAV